MSDVVDFQKIVRQAAMYGAALKTLPLKVDCPSSMDLDEQVAFTASVNSIFAHLRALQKAGVDPASVAMGAITATASYVATTCPDHIKQNFVKMCVQNFEHFVKNTEFIQKEAP